MSGKLQQQEGFAKWNGKRNAILPVCHNGQGLTIEVLLTNDLSRVNTSKARGHWAYQNKVDMMSSLLGFHFGASIYNHLVREGWLLW
jgi:hypothetical protein